MAKSNDFEVHLIGTTTELKLSRALVNEITMYDIEIFPEPVQDKIKDMLKFYSDVVNAERYENGI